MPQEGSPPQAAVLPSSRLRRRRRRRTWCRISCIPRSCFGPPREDKESPNWFPWFSLRKVKRSLSVRGGTSVVASELEKEKEKEKEDRGKEGEGNGREIPTIIVESVRPTFLQGLFTKALGGKESRKTNKHKTQARRSISSDQENRSEIVVLPCPLPPPPPPPPPPRNHPTVPPLYSSPCRRENNQLNGKFQYESCSTAGRSPHSPCNKKERNYSKKKQDSSLAGFVIAMVMLLMLAVGGRMFAMICTSAFLYLSSYFNKGPTVESDGANNIVKGKRHATVAVDYESEEYRKKVLMGGMLKRDGRRLVS